MIFSIQIMKIILVIVNSKGKKVAFITDSGITLNLQEAIDAVKQHILEHIHLFITKTGTFLRSNRNGLFKDNLDNIVLTYNEFQNNKNPFQELKAELLEKKYLKTDIIYLDGYACAYKTKLISRIAANKNNIIQSAKKYHIEPNILAAILADEYCRLNFDDTFDCLAAFGRDASVGLAQIKISTARDMIKKGIYSDLSISLSDQDLYNNLIKDQISIDVAAARIRQLIDFWKPKYDLSHHPELIGTLYSQGLGQPKSNPKSIDRGDQVKNILIPIIIPILK